LARADLEDIDRMSGQQFESHLEVLFTRLGYHAETTEQFDKGADLILLKGGVRTAVQAKCWKKPVDVEAVRAVIAAMRPYKCTHGMVVTNSTFTRPARQAARDNNIELWDRTYLANVLLAVNKPGQPLPVPGAVSWLFSEPSEIFSPPIQLAPVSEGYTCVTCRKQVTKGIREYCLDQPQRFGGQVYCMDHQRQVIPLPQRETREAAD
jgi:restriction system protein